MRRIASAAVGLCLCAASGPTGSNPLGNDPSKFDILIETAALRGDTRFFDSILAPDVRFTHGTGAVWDRNKWLGMVRPGSYFTARNLRSDEVERHGNLVETAGQVDISANNPRNPQYHIWFVRLYARRDGRWQLISNRTVRQVNGPFPGE